MLPPQFSGFQGYQACGAGAGDIDNFRISSIDMDFSGFLDIEAYSLGLGCIRCIMNGTWSLSKTFVPIPIGEDDDSAFPGGDQDNLGFHQFTEGCCGNLDIFKNWGRWEEGGTYINDCFDYPSGTHHCPGGGTPLPIGITLAFAMQREASNNLWHFSFLASAFMGYACGGSGVGGFQVPLLNLSQSGIPDNDIFGVYTLTDPGPGPHNGGFGCGFSNPSNRELYNSTLTVTVNE